VVLAGALFLRAQGAGKTVLDKVYTEQQAGRGADAYEANCAMCHEGEEPDALPPRDKDFLDHWREAPLSYLFTHIRTKMPGDAPGKLPEATYLDIIAHILNDNGFPAGTTELTADKVGGILMVGLDGPKPLPTGALVRVVGCLVPVSADVWSLTSASAPTRVRVSDETTPEELAQSTATPPGAAAYRLRNAEDFKADSLKGQRVQAKGSLSNTSIVNVHSLERTGTNCDK